MSIQEARIPIIALYANLIVPIQGAIADDVMAALQRDVTQRIQDTDAKGLVVDVSGVEILDSYLTRNLRDLALTARLMGVTAVVSGLRPAVAITLVDMGLENPGRAHRAEPRARARAARGAPRGRGAGPGRLAGLVGPMTALAEGVVGALEGFFPPAIARAVLRSALRRGGLAESVREHEVAELVDALERTLPMYIVDAKRRGECVDRVRRALAVEPRDTPPPSPRPRPARDTPRVPAPPEAAPESVPKEPAGPEAGTVRVRSARDVVQACDLARAIARTLGFSLLDQTKIATAASELARNILLYVGDGEVRVRAFDVPRRGIEIVAADAGGGIADVGLVLNSGYRSNTGMGMGLQGTKRLMDELEIDSRPGVGTTVVAKKHVS